MLKPERVGQWRESSKTDSDDQEPPMRGPSYRAVVPPTNLNYYVQLFYLDSKCITMAVEHSELEVKREIPKLKTMKLLGTTKCRSNFQESE